MLSRLSMAQKGFIAVLILVLAELSFVSVLAVELNTLRNRLEMERHSRAIVEHLNLFATATQRTAAEILKALPLERDAREALGLGKYKPQLAIMRQEMRILRKEFKDDPTRLKDIQRMEAVTAEMEVSMDYLLTLPRIALTPQKISTVYQAGTKLIRLCDQLMQSYERVESLPSSTEQSLQRVETALSIEILIAIVGNMIAVTFFVRRVAGRIFIIIENVARFGRQESLLPEQNAEDEIGTIDKAFHNLARALTEASEQERILIENSTDVVCSIDTKGEFVTISPAAADQWGYEPEELIGDSVERALSANSIIPHFERWNYSAGEGATLNFEERLTRKDGIAIDTLWSVHWSPIDGTFFCCVRDISEAKQMDKLVAAQEEQLRNVIENMPLGIVTVDRKGTIKGTNKIGTELLCIDSNRLDHRTITEFLDTGNGADSLLEIGPFNPVRLPLKATEKPSRFVDVTSVHSRGRQDEILILLDDATERHVLEQMKQHLVTLLGNNLSDPLKNVQSIIRGLVERKAFDDVRQARLRRVDLNLKRLLSLLAQLLNVEQLGVGKLIGELRSCCVQDIVTEAVESTKDYSEQQKIHLIWEKPPTPIAIVGDAERLVQVIINLIGNAIKYSPPNSMVSITVHQGPTDIEVKISDQGRGVPEDMRESIFLPFVQTESSDGRRGTGTGLGLSICRQIIEGHGGKIGVHGREETKGSVFWIKLPNTRSTSNR